MLLHDLDRVFDKELVDIIEQALVVDRFLLHDIFLNAL
jgi:hypothetical protein